MKQLADYVAFQPNYLYCNCPTPIPVRNYFKDCRYCMNCKKTVKEGS